ncbi:MAG: glucosidase [Myxococcota bacterium]
MDRESERLFEDAERKANWKRWGPYLAERQWATVREDYSPSGEVWDYFPHEHARSRAYRWGEDGLMGFTDRECRLAFSVALWNEQDPILKERLFGLTGPEGNHGEDVKELYYYLDSTPTHSYVRGLYKYPQSAYPYAWLLEESRRRGLGGGEPEILESGAFSEDRYFDVEVEYAKASPDDILIRITVSNRGPDAAPIHVLPTLLARNTWIWGCTHEGCWLRPRLRADGDSRIQVIHQTLEPFSLSAELPDELLFTENETNTALLYGVETYTPYTKDAFHRWLIQGDKAAINPSRIGTKVAAHYRLTLAPGQSRVIRLRLTSDAANPSPSFGASFDHVFRERREEADAFYAARLPKTLSVEEARVARQAYAGLLMSKQFYHYVVKDWLEGDPHQPKPPPERLKGRNKDWPQLFARDVILMPDKWEYPWFAAWDLAFHVVPLARIDPELAQSQLLLFLREWYMHPNGQIPAYEFAFGDVNPPVHAWAVLKVYRQTQDRTFLARAFHKLLLNFTWWVNRKDEDGDNVFGGGFLGLDNIGVFDRSKPLPTGGSLRQADGTAWMAFYCSTMLDIALELAAEDPVYEDVASKFFEHFVAIADAMNTLGGNGLWHEQDGFYYDQLLLPEGPIPMAIRSLVGIVPLLAVGVLEQSLLDRLPGFKKRLDWFLAHRKDLRAHISYFERPEADQNHRRPRLLAIPTRERLERVLSWVFDETEFLSPHGVRSLSRVHLERPYSFWVGGEEHRVGYQPGESDTHLFGGNSNWRGPVWFPLNYLLIEALDKYHEFFGDEVSVELPRGSGRRLSLKDAGRELARRLSTLFLPNGEGARPAHGPERVYAERPEFRELILFYEYFHGDTGQGLGASHQTGWTALVAECLHRVHGD